MQHQITQGRALLQVELSAHEALLVAPSALVGMSPGILCEKQPIVQRPQHLPFVTERYQARESTARLTLAPPVPGPILHIPLSEGKQWLVNASAWLASATTVDNDYQWGGAHSFFPEDGPLLLKVEGKGPLFVSAASAFHLIEVRGSHSVYGSALVAFEGTLQYETKRLSSSLKESRLYRFSGRGRALLQTQPLGVLTRWAEPYT